MTEKNQYPSQYEDVFNLILSLIEQVRSDVNKKEPVSPSQLEKYFHRLARGTIGEYEFTRRMAFENYPVIRIAAFPVLWIKYSQPVTPDFIVRIDNKLACVEVKNYIWQTYTKELVIKKVSLENCKKFRDFMKLDLSCIAIRRFEKWYLIDTDEYLKHAKEVRGYYRAPINEVLDKNLLNEDLVVFNMGNQSDSAKERYNPPDNSTDKGVYYKGIKVNKELKELKVKYGNTMESEALQFEGNQKEVIEIIYETIEKNLRDIFSNGLEFDDIEFIEDILPTRFAITDKLRDKFKIQDVVAIFNTLTKTVVYIGKNEDTTYYLYRIACIIYHKYQQLLETQNIDFKEMKKLMPKLNDFRRTFD